MEEDEALEWARTFGLFTFPIPYSFSAKQGKLSKRRIYWGAEIRSTYAIIRSLSRKGRQQLTPDLYGLLFPVQGKEWLELEEDAQKAYVMGLLDRLEVVSRERRLKVARAVLYLAQGEWPALPT